MRRLLRGVERDWAVCPNDGGLPPRVAGVCSGQRNHRSGKVCSGEDDLTATWRVAASFVGGIAIFVGVVADSWKIALMGIMLQMWSAYDLAYEARYGR
jgi:hypothetical protein